MAFNPYSGIPVSLNVLIYCAALVVTWLNVDLCVPVCVGLCLVGAFHTSLLVALSSCSVSLCTAPCRQMLCRVVSCRTELNSHTAAVPGHRACRHAAGSLECPDTAGGPRPHQLHHRHHQSPIGSGPHRHQF